MSVSKLNLSKHAFFEEGRCMSKVLSKNDHGFFVEHKGRKFSVKKSSSCLLVLDVGDTVAVAPIDGDLWVLSVLKKVDLAQTTMDFKGDLLISSSGKLALESSENITIQTPRHASLAAGELLVIVKRARFVCELFNVFSRKFDIYAQNIRSFSKRIEEFSEYVHSHYGQCKKKVERHEEKKNGSFRQVTKGSSIAGSENSILTARKHLAIDAEKIHLG